MKWTRAVHHLSELAEKCAERAALPESIRGLPVVGLWAFGDILGEQQELDVVQVAVVVDLPEVPWRELPDGAEHWANATRMRQNPISALWRSAHTPVWNHYVDRPALIWNVEDGIASQTLAALHDGKGGQFRLPAPAAAEMRARLADELALSLRFLRAQTQTYDDRRWTPGKLTPVADALWRAVDGYLDILDASGLVTVR